MWRMWGRLERSRSQSLKSTCSCSEKNEFEQNDSVTEEYFSLKLGKHIKGSSAFESQTKPQYSVCF